MARRHRARRQGICTYCGQNAILTNDHVPPNNLFVPGTLGRIKVPACEPCNNSYKQDDEYFRLAITSGHEPHEARSDVTLEATSKLAAPAKTGLRTMMLSRIREAEVFTSEGLYLGNVVGMDVDPDRVYRVLRRVLRGLVFHHLGQRLNPVYEPTVRWFGEIHADPARIHQVLAALRNAERRSIGGHVFSYRFVAVGDPVERSVWSLCFFEHYEFLGFVRHPEGRTIV
jgi:hypothetical protein